MSVNKKKLFNDPVYGFIHVTGELIFDIIEHPFVQRLRRIKQLGLTDLVYPGALHTRFHHALGAMHLMGVALHTLRKKGHEISDHEIESASLASLLHDIGHGPFSHALEGHLIPNLHHESLTLYLMHQLNKEFRGSLDTAIDIFTKQYPRKFLSQLVSGQLDVDRLDYLNRDSFFTGVTEGSIGVENILRMLELKEDTLVVEEKGIYSIESFLHARRIMYWQVYMHKTSVAAEQMLVAALERARFLYSNTSLEDENSLFSLFKLQKAPSAEEQELYYNHFTALDDSDIYHALKTWSKSEDHIIRGLSKGLLERKLFKCTLSSDKPDTDKIKKISEELILRRDVSKSELKYLLRMGQKSNAGYLSNQDQIQIITKKGRLIEISKASDLPNIKALGRVVKKYYLCHPKNLSL